MAENPATSLSWYTILQQQNNTTLKFLRAIEIFQPRLHWGKYLNLTSERAREIYPKAGDFVRIRAELDPEGIFVNKLTSDVFGFSD